MSYLPFIDYKKLLASDPSTIQLLQNTLHEIGFFYLHNLDISEFLFDDVLSQSKVFFSQECNEKEKISINKSIHYRGYSKLEDEITNGIPDYKEIIDFGLEQEEKKSTIHYHRMVGPNLWPSEDSFPTFKKNLLTYMQHLIEIGLNLMKSIAESLGLEKDFFLQEFKGAPFSLMRIIHYPPSLDITQKKIGVGEHTDFGCLALLHQDQVGGLEVKTRQGSWVKAEPVKNTLIVNIGDMLEQWTNGYFIATPHRVLNTVHSDRYSVPFFFEPNIDTRIKPISLKHITSEVTLKENPNQMVYGEHIFKAFKRSFPNHPSSSF